MKTASAAFAAMMGLAFCASAAAQDDVEKKPAPCTAAEYRQFDFWLGEWDVTPAGKDAPAAVNRISPQHGGCVVLEEYEAGAFSGMSLNFYDEAAGQWRQTWMSNQGAPLYLAGGLDKTGAMVMSDKGLVDGETINRITWTPNDDGSVRQLWEQPEDDGENWKVVFDGLYTLKQDE